jgi:CheY-like chemotaxis protein
VIVQSLPADKDAEDVSRCQVLIVDDDDTIRETLADVLRYFGYMPCQAQDGRMALDLLRGSPVGMVVLLDVNMPGMDGRQLLRVVANDDQLAIRHAFVVMSAYRGSLPLEFDTLLRELGVPVLGKPFDVDHLLGMVAAAEQRLVAAR